MKINNELLQRGTIMNGFFVPESIQDRNMKYRVEKATETLTLLRGLSFADIKQISELMVAIAQFNSEISTHGNSEISAHNKVTRGDV